MLDVAVVLKHLQRLALRLVDGVDQRCDFFRRAPAPDLDLGVWHTADASILAAMIIELSCRPISAPAPITDADARLVAPADILHMREGDVPSLRIHTRLRYVGHLKHGRRRSRRLSDGLSRRRPARRARAQPRGL